MPPTRAPALILALAAAASSGGCAATVVTAAVGAATLQLQDRPVGQGIDDATGAAAVRALLLRDDSAAFLRVGVEMSDGQVVLTGSVPTIEHRALAEREAWRIASVSSVANEITVGPRAGLYRSARDEVLGAQVRAAFVADKRIKSINYNIDTYDGSIYLMGLARTDDELRLAAETAAAVRGAKRVVSYVVVRRQPEVLSAEDAALRSTRSAPGAPIYGDEFR